MGNKQKKPSGKKPKKTLERIAKEKAEQQKGQ